MVQVLDFFDIRVIDVEHRAYIAAAGGHHIGSEAPGVEQFLGR